MRLIRIFWKTPTLIFFDPRISESEREVQQMIHLQSLANRLPNPFINAKKVMKSHIPAQISIVTPNKNIASDLKVHHKRGSPLGSKYIIPYKRK